jgi:hypothetical protein
MSPASPFAIADYRFYWVARLASTIAQMSMVIVIGWQVYDIARLTMSTKEAALQLGLVGIVQFVPLFVLTLVTGWTADRLDRRVVARATIALEVLCAAILGYMSWAGTVTLPALFAVAALLGVARAFAMPALQALSPNLVPREILPKAIAMSSIAWQSGAIAGPAIGGYLLGAAHALLGRRRSIRPVAAVHVHDRPQAAFGHRRIDQSVAPDDRRTFLCPPEPAGAGRDLAGPVRGPARRRHRDAADLRPRHPPGRSHRPRPSARRTGNRATLIAPISRSAAQAQCQWKMLGAVGVRRGDDRLGLR